MNTNQSFTSPRQYNSATGALATSALPISAETGSDWLAVQTRSNFERVACAELSKQAIEAFLPTRKLIRHWSDRKKLIEEPVFKGYLFVRPGITQTASVLRTIGICRYVGPSQSSPWTIPNSEICALQRFVSEDLRIDPHPYLRKGQKVYVKKGPLKGLEGYIVRKPRFCRLVITVELMMQSVSVEIDESLLELA